MLRPPLSSDLLFVVFYPLMLRFFPLISSVFHPQTGLLCVRVSSPPENFLDLQPFVFLCRSNPLRLELHLLHLPWLIFTQGICAVGGHTYSVEHLCLGPKDNKLNHKEKLNKEKKDSEKKSSQKDSLLPYEKQIKKQQHSKK